MKKSTLLSVLSIILMSHMAMQAHLECSGNHYANTDIYKTYVDPFVLEGQKLFLLTYNNGLLFYNNNKELVHTSAIITAVVGMAYIFYRSTCSVESSCQCCKKKNRL